MADQALPVDEISTRNSLADSSRAKIAPLPAKIAEIIRCPRCLARLTATGGMNANNRWACTNEQCAYAKNGFPAASGGVPVLVDFDKSVLSRNDIELSVTEYATSSDWLHVKDWFLQSLLCSREPTSTNAKSFLRAVHGVDKHPKVLIIGGATRGLGTQTIYADPDICLIGLDIYCTTITDLVADGHNLPLADGSIDGVWIQAVLEHVLEPHRVVEEIHRVLRRRGVVYAETPFMQQVHMGSSDFTRFTPSGHRWLFRRFDEIGSGVREGPGTTILWSIKYFVASIFGTYKMGTLVAVMFFWLRFFDYVAWGAFAFDGASGVYFLGRRSDRSLSPKEILSLYRGALRNRSRDTNESKSPSLRKKTVWRLERSACD
jgi:SAM-dependent methyltransferase